MKYADVSCALILFSISCATIAAGQSLPVTIIDQNSYWRYTFSPEEGWNNIDYNSSSWDIGICPFSNGATGGHDTCPSGIEIFTGFPLNKTLYARDEFELTKIPESGKLYLAYANAMTVYLNGINLGLRTHEGCGSYWNDEISVSGFRIGKNVLACVVEAGNESAFFDAMLTEVDLAENNTSNNLIPKMDHGAMNQLKVTFETTGGIGGLMITKIVDSEKLPADQADRLRQLVKASHFFELPAATPYIGPTRDFFHYKVTIESEGIKHTVESDEPAVPSELEPLLEWLRTSEP
jgi:hypothetical protein